MTRRRRKKAGPVPLILISFVLLAALVVTMLTYYAIVVRPWVAEPDVTERELAQLWEPIEREVAVPLDVTEKIGHLRHAIKRLEEIDRERLEDIIARWRKNGDAALQPEDRDALNGVREVGEYVVRWMQSGHGLAAEDPCQLDKSLAPLDVLFIGRLALTQAAVVSGGPLRSDRLRSVLRLAWAMRRSGGPVALAVGMNLAEHTAAVAKRLGALDVLQANEDLAPRTDEIWRAINVEAFCADALVVREFETLRSGWPTGRGTEAAPRTWIELGPSYLNRERQMLRLWWGRRLDSAAQYREAPTELARVLRLPADWDELPRSTLVRLMAADLSEPIESAERSVVRYREMAGLDGGRAPEKD